MKKASVILIGLVFALSLVGAAFAQEKAKPAAEPAKPAEPAKTEAAKPGEAAKPEAAKPAEAKKEAPKVVKYRAGGIVQAVDVKAKKITIKQERVKKERVLKLNVGKKAAKELGSIKVGDEVNVWVTGNTVTELVKVF